MRCGEFSKAAMIRVVETSATSPEDALAVLHRSLDARLRPEDAAGLVLTALAGRLRRRERVVLGRAAEAARRWGGWTSMSMDFARPVGGARQVAATARLFDVTTSHVGVDNPASLLEFAAMVGSAIGAAPGQLDFLRDRLNREARAAAGVEVPKRQYNRQFRALQRLAAKAERLNGEQDKRRLTLTARAGFVADISLERFRADPDAGCFVAYYTARRKVRRQFTLAGRNNPYDEVADMLFHRCVANPSTDWPMVALAYAPPDVVGRLTDAERGTLLGRWSAVMRATADRLARVWAVSHFDRATMVVRKGDDSSTWNLLCGAYNSARAGWLSCLTASGATAALDVECPGKAMMLIAADLAAWHRTTGGLHPDVGVSTRLPLPWDVLAGRGRCTRADVEAACAEAGVDPEKGGWTAPRAPGAVAVFTPTPELVHGVSVVDPMWALVLRTAGVFSGKPTRASATAVVAEGVPAQVVASDLPSRPISDGQSGSM